jgi:hypothetical protein
VSALEFEQVGRKLWEKLPTIEIEIEIECVWIGKIDVWITVEYSS